MPNYSLQHLSNAMCWNKGLKQQQKCVTIKHLWTLFCFYLAVFVPQKLHFFLLNYIRLRVENPLKQHIKTPN